ncbi:MAG TPA: polysaccharide ABC transporter ATP-binding protein, partial [Chitinophagaceae bacterium]|nr:polysaccharide ABC transporter ATP-binding protein [Chitinophagaceae bacterium]
NRWLHLIIGKKDPYLKIGEENDRSRKGTSEYVWALKDINFEVNHGDILGIIGRNGAGKSTLLKILSKVTSPTTGSVKIKGRIASLLEVGTGFHPELSGRDNIFLNGAILGMTRKEIQNKFDEIVDFAAVERYVDTPVKRYSSGMYVRLAFAVAAHLEPDILIVDEVLAVGDAEFQKKCLGKMKDVSEKEGRTVLFVSHNMDAIINLCNTSIVLNNGTVDLIDNSFTAVEHYLKHKENNKRTEWNFYSNNDMPYIKYASVELQGTQPVITLRINLKIFSKKKNAKDAFIAVDIKNSLGVTIAQAIPVTMPFISFEKNELSYECSIELIGFIPGGYFLSLWIGPHYTHTYHFAEEVLYFEINQSPNAGRTLSHTHNHGFFVPGSSIKLLS